MKNMKMEAYRFYNSVWHREEELQGVISKLYKVGSDLLEIVQAYNNGETCPACGSDWLETTESPSGYVCSNTAQGQFSGITNCELDNALRTLSDLVQYKDGE